jgi:hypothetical protein
VGFFGRAATCAAMLSVMLSVSVDQRERHDRFAWARSRREPALRCWPGERADVRARAGCRPPGSRRFRPGAQRESSGRDEEGSPSSAGWGSCSILATYRRSIETVGLEQPGGAKGLALSLKWRYLSQPSVHRRGRTLHFRRFFQIAAKVSGSVVTESPHLVRPTRAALPVAPRLEDIRGRTDERSNGTKWPLLRRGVSRRSIGSRS